MASIMETMTTMNAMDLISVVWVEVTMASLAAMVWFTISGTVLLPKTSKKIDSSPGKQSPRSPRGGDDQSALYQLAVKALRQGRLSEAISLVQQLPEVLDGNVPANIAPRLLMAVAKAANFDEALSQLKVFVGKVEARALEAVMLEASKNKDVAACRNLNALAEPMSISKTLRTLEALARGFSSDVAALRGLVAEVETPFSKGFASAVLEACAILKETDLAAEVFEKASEADAAALRAVVEKASLAAVKPPRPASPTDSLAKEIRTLGKSGNCAGAMKAFDNASAQVKNAFLYNAILEACIDCSNFHKAIDYFSQANEAGSVDVVTFNIMMKGYLSQGNNEAANRLLKEISEKGLSPTHSSYHGLLNARVVAQDRKGAWKLVDEMKGAQVTPNMITCSILLKSKSNSADDISKILDMVDATDQKMDDVFFATIVEACARTHSFDLLSKQTAKFAREGGSLAVTAPTYGSMIKAYGQMWDVMRVWELWEEMIANNVEPTAVTLGCMVEALVSNLCTADAWKLAQQLLKEEKTKPLVNTVIYSTIIKGFAHMKDVSKVMALYDEMRGHGLRANTITYNTILNAFAQSGAMDRVPALLEDMKTANPPVEPDIVTYSTIIKGFCNSGGLDRALQIVDDMRRDGKYAPDEVMYNSLLDGCAKEQRPDDALKLFAEMKKNGVAPSNYTLSMLVKLLGRCRRLNETFAIIDELHAEYGLKMNIQVYTCLISACFNNRQAFKAINLHEQMLKDGLQPDEMLNNVLVQGCLKAKLVDKAVQVAKCACGVGIAKGKHAPSGLGEKCLSELMSALGGPTSKQAIALKAELGEGCVSPKGKGKGKR